MVQDAWGQYTGGIRFIEKPSAQDEWGRPVAELSSEPPAAVRHGSARQSSGTGPRGVCSRVLWVPDPRSQYLKKIRFIENHGVQDEGRRYVSKNSFYPAPAAVRFGRAMQSSGRDRVGIVVGSCRKRARGVSIRGKFILFRNLGYKMRGSPGIVTFLF